jgi:hypothetical protein
LPGDAATRAVFFPTTYGQPYADYLATSTLFIWLLSCRSAVTSLTAWLPSAIAGGDRHADVPSGAPCSSRWALLSIALCCSPAPSSPKCARCPRLDARGGGIAGVLSGLRPRPFLGTRRWLLIFACCCWVCGLRGPIGLVIPTGMLCSYYLLNRQWRQLFSFGLTAAVLLACVGAAVVMAKLSGGKRFMQDVIRMQFMGRMDGSEGVSGPLYYFTSSMGNYALAYPLALLALLGWPWANRIAAPALRWCSIALQPG